MNYSKAMQECITDFGVEPTLRMLQEAFEIKAHEAKREVDRQIYLAAAFEISGAIQTFRQHEKRINHEILRLEEMRASMRREIVNQIQKDATPVQHSKDYPRGWEAV